MKLEEKLLKQLGKRKKGYTSAELAEKLNADRNYIQRTLRGLVVAFKVESIGKASRFTVPVYRIPEVQIAICE